MRVKEKENKYVRKDIYEADKENINQRIDDLKDNVNRSISGLGFLVCVIGFLFAGLQVGVALMLYVITRGV